MQDVQNLKRRGAVVAMVPDTASSRGAEDEMSADSSATFVAKQSPAATHAVAREADGMIPNTEQSLSSDDSFPLWAIVAVVVGVALLFCALLTAFAWLWRRQSAMSEALWWEREQSHMQGDKPSSVPQSSLSGASKGSEDSQHKSASSLRMHTNAHAVDAPQTISDSPLDGREGRWLHNVCVLPQERFQSGEVAPLYESGAADTHTNTAAAIAAHSLSPSLPSLPNLPSSTPAAPNNPYNAQNMRATHIVPQGTATAPQWRRFNENMQTIPQEELVHGRVESTIDESMHEVRNIDDLGTQMAAPSGMESSFQKHVQITLGDESSSEFQLVDAARAVSSTSQQQWIKRRKVDLLLDTEVRCSSFYSNCFEVYCTTTAGPPYSNMCCSCCSVDDILLFFAASMVT